MKIKLVASIAFLLVVIPLMATSQPAHGRTMPMPQAVVVSGLSVGGVANYALLPDGALKAWGAGQNGRIGDGTTINRSTPVDVRLQPSDQLRQVSGGGDHACAATVNNDVLCWGWNAYRQTGSTSSSDQLYPFKVAALNGSAASVDAGGQHSCAVMNSGGIKCWGANSYGQLGIGPSGTSVSAAPLDVVGLGATALAVSTGYLHSCALLSNRTVKCWGHNGYGQLGNNGNADSPSPVDVIGLDGDVSGIAAGWYHNCALHTAGKVKCWGSNSNGQIGNNTTMNQKTAVEVISRDALSIAAGGYQTCAVRTLGKAQCWGKNNYSQLGDNTTTDRWVPVDVQGLYGFVQAIGTDGGLYSWGHSCALLSNSKVQCWGNNYWGQLGDGTSIDHKLPAPVVGLEGVKRPEARFNYNTAKPGSPLVLVASDMPEFTGLTIFANGQQIPSVNFGGTLTTDANGQYQLGWMVSGTTAPGVYAIKIKASTTGSMPISSSAPSASAEEVEASAAVWITTTAPLRDAPNPFPSNTLNSMPPEVMPYTFFVNLPLVHWSQVKVTVKLSSL